MKNVGRRSFLRLAAISFIAVLGFVWNKITLNRLEVKKQKASVLPYNKNRKVSFVENYIIISNEGKTVVLSAHCSHLGCKINRTEMDRLVCPCHGSEYDLNGNVLKGPAYRNLEVIPAKVISDGTQIEIEG